MPWESLFPMTGVPGVLTIDELVEAAEMDILTLVEGGFELEEDPISPICCRLAMSFANMVGRSA